MGIRPETIDCLLLAVVLAASACRATVPARIAGPAHRLEIHIGGPVRDDRGTRGRASPDDPQKTPTTASGSASGESGAAVETPETDPAVSPAETPFVSGSAGVVVAGGVVAGGSGAIDAGAGVSVGVGMGVDVGVDGEVGSETPRVVDTVALPLEGAEVAEFFGIPLDGARDVVFVLDRSGSMSEVAQGEIARLASTDRRAQAPRKIEVARRELIAALEEMADGVQLNVIYFNTDLEAYAADRVILDSAHRERLKAFVVATGPAGRTALATAMRTAFMLHARRVVLLSDGLGNVGGDAQMVLRDAREAMLGGVRIDTIGLGYDQDRELLETLARESGGIYQGL